MLAYENWLEPLVTLAESNPKIGVIGSKLVFPLTTNQVPELIQSCGGMYDVQHSPYHRYLGWDANDPRVNKVEKVEWTTGAAFFTRRNLFYQLGGFDETYGRGYFEEVDYCERAKQVGFEVWYCPQSVLTHFVGQSMDTTPKDEKSLLEAARSFRNNAATFHARWDALTTPDVQVPMVNF